MSPTNKTITIPRRKPEAKGMMVVEMKDWPIDKVIPSSKNKNKNLGRPCGINPKQVESFGNLIKNSTYKPEYHIPPVGEVIDGYLHLSTGENRYSAHVEVCQKTFYAASVVWVDEDGMSGSYWKKAYTSNENDHRRNEVGGDQRTPQGIASVILKMLSDGDIQPNDEQIGRALTDQNIPKNSASWKNILNDVKSQIGLVDVVRSVNPSEARKLEKDNTTSDTNCVARVHNKETPTHRDYTPRLINDVLIPNLKGYLSGEEVKNQKVIYYFNGMTSPQIQKVRPLLEDKTFLDDFYHKVCKPFVSLYESNVFHEKVKVTFPNQLKGDNYQDG